MLYLFNFRKCQIVLCLHEILYCIQFNKGKFIVDGARAERERNANGTRAERERRNRELKNLNFLDASLCSHVT